MPMRAYMKNSQSEQEMLDTMDMRELLLINTRQRGPEKASRGRGVRAEGCLQLVMGMGLRPEDSRGLGLSDGRITNLMGFRERCGRVQVPDSRTLACLLLAARSLTRMRVIPRV